jgi:glycosyltransferase involved in cell wall biosynthesis
VLKRVCMYTPSAYGGHAQYTWELLSAIRDVCGDNTCACELVTSSDLDPKFRSDRYAQHPILPRLRRPSEYPTKLHWAASRVTHYVRRERALLKWIKTRPDVDAVHLQECTPWLAARIVRALRGAGKKVLYTVHNVRPHAYPRFVPRATVHNWYRSAWRNCHALFVHTDQLRDELSTFLGPGHPPIHVVPHGIWSTEEPNTIPSLRERLAWKRILFFGAIRPNKGLHLLLDQFDSLRGYSLTIAGQTTDAGYFSEQIKPRIDRLRAAGTKIEVTSQFIPDEQVPSLFASHGVLALPYSADFHAQSGVIFLALSHRIPVIASTAGGLKDLLSRFRIGLPFDPATPGSAAKALEGLAQWSDDDFTSELRRATEEFSWRKAAERTVNAYREVTRAGA